MTESGIYELYLLAQDHPQQCPAVYIYDVRASDAPMVDLFPICASTGFGDLGIAHNVDYFVTVVRDGNVLNPVLQTTGTGQLATLFGSQVFGGVIAGLYDITIVDVNGCTFTFQLTPALELNCKTGAAADFVETTPALIAPNPTAGMVSITFPEATSTSLQLYDMYGKLILTEKTFESQVHQLNMSELPAGIYMLQIGDKQTQRIMKQ